jgi:hypothetical protein
MSYSFARKFDLPSVRGVGAVDPDDVVEISRSKLMLGGVMSAVGGTVLGAAIVGTSFGAAMGVGKLIALVTPVGALVAGSALVLGGYYTLSKSYDKPELAA